MASLLFQCPFSWPCNGVGHPTQLLSLLSLNMHAGRFHVGIVFANKEVDGITKPTNPKKAIKFPALLQNTRGNCRRSTFS